MKKKVNKYKCSKCGKKEAKFFHSFCCGVHFEGVIDKDGPIIVCEKCGKYVASVGIDPKKENKIYKIK